MYCSTLFITRLSKVRREVSAGLCRLARAYSKAMKSKEVHKRNIEREANREHAGRTAQTVIFGRTRKIDASLTGCVRHRPETKAGAEQLGVAGELPVAI